MSRINLKWTQKQCHEVLMSEQHHSGVFLAFFFFFCEQVDNSPCRKCCKNCQILRYPPLNCRFFLEEVQGTRFPWVAGGIYESSWKTTRNVWIRINNLFNSEVKYTKNTQKGEKDFKHKEHFHHKFNTEHLERPSQHHTAMPYVSTSYFWPQCGCSFWPTRAEYPASVFLGKTFQSNFFCIHFHCGQIHLEHFGQICPSSHWKIISSPTTAPWCKMFFLTLSKRVKVGSKSPWRLYHWETKTAWDSPLRALPALVHCWRSVNAFSFGKKNFMTSTDVSLESLWVAGRRKRWERGTETGAQTCTSLIICQK